MKVSVLGGEESPSLNFSEMISNLVLSRVRARQRHLPFLILPWEQLMVSKVKQLSLLQTGPGRIIHSAPETIHQLISTASTATYWLLSWDLFFLTALRLE